MLKFISTVLFLFYLNFGFSQNSKKEIIYKNLKGEIINESNFQKITSDKKILIHTTENDSIVIKKIFEYDNRGFFESEQVDIIRQAIEKITETKVEKTDILVINFFIFPQEAPRGSCIDSYTSDRVYKSFFTKKKNSHIKQFFITEATFEYKKEGVFRDKQAIIGDLCFSDAMQCGNYIIIFPDHSYIKRYCEYRQSEILDFLKQNKKTN